MSFVVFIQSILLSIGFRCLVIHGGSLGDTVIKLENIFNKVLVKKCTCQFGIRILVVKAFPIQIINATP